MQISEHDLERAAAKVGLTVDQSRAIWHELRTTDERKSHFEPAHVAYYFGALLVIGAMGWFITDGWDRFAGWQLSVIAAGYAAIFLIVARRLWPRLFVRIPAGLLVTMAVCMTPLFVYGIERQFGWWPSTYPGSYVHFHPWIHASWVGMELVTVMAAMIALLFYDFPFLTAPLTYALWYMSMDVTALIFGREWQWRDRCMISAIFGAIMLLVTYKVDRRTEFLILGLPVRPAHIHRRLDRDGNRQ